MRMKAIHAFPVEAHENPLACPPFTDERMLPWVQLLNELGALKDYVVIGENASLMQGVCSSNYTYQIEWDQS